MKNKGFAVIVLIFVISSCISWNLYFKHYSQEDTVSIHLFPKKIGEWTAEEIPISDDEYAILETRNAFVRKYSNPKGEAVYLFMVYSQNNRKVSHPPEICYTGSGATVLGSFKEIIPLGSPSGAIEANNLELSLGRLKQYSYYWFKVGDTFTSNYWKQQSLIAVKTLLAQPASSALIRVSTDILNNENDAARALIYKFVPVIIPDILRYLP